MSPQRVVRAVSLPSEADRASAVIAWCGEALLTGSSQRAEWVVEVFRSSSVGVVAFNDLLREFEVAITEDDQWSRIDAYISKSPYDYIADWLDDAGLGLVVSWPGQSARCCPLCGSK